MTTSLLSASRWIPEVSGRNAVPGLCRGELENASPDKNQERLIATW